MSKSEENLLTPKRHNKVVYRMSWNSPTVTDSQEISSNEGILPENSSSESAFIFEKLPVLPGEYRLTAEDQQDSKLNLCEEANNLTAETLLKVKQAFSGSGSNLHHLRADTKSSFSGVTDETLKETLCLTGLSPEKELVAGVSHSPAKVESRELFHQQCQSCDIDKQQPKKDEMKTLERKSFRTSLEIELQVQKPDIRNIIELPVTQVLAREDNLAVQNSSSKDDLKLHSFGRKEELELLHSQTAENGTVKCCSSEEGTAKLPGAGQLPALQLPVPGNEVGNQYLQAENSAKTLTKASTVPDHGKVSDHIQWFNRLSLNDPSSASKTKPPLKFQRTPVRQSVRRINSLLEANKRPISSQLSIVNDVGSPLVKSLSCDSALSSCTEKPNKNSSALSLKSKSTFDQVSTSHSQLDLTSKPCCRHLCLLDKPDGSVRTAGIYRQKVTVHPSKSVLEDLTNQETVKSCLKVNTDVNIPDFAPEKSTITRSVPGKEKARYRGSPKNPISKVKLLPTAKPVDL